MNIIVLGASSNIGSAIASAFAPGNDLILVGRDSARLGAAVERCLTNGAKRAIPLYTDLRRGCDDILQAISAWPVDVILNSASATSRLRDDELATAQLSEYVMVDLLAPLELVREVCARQTHRPVSVVFLSTILTQVKSPNRSIYSSLKTLQEECLRSLQASQQMLHVLIVRIAKVIPADGPASASDKLALAVRKAFDKKRPTLLYGFSGRLLKTLYYTQPFVFRLAIQARRLLMPRSEPGNREA